MAGTETFSATETYPADEANPVSIDIDVAPGASGIVQAEEQISRGRREVQIIRAIGGCPTTVDRPAVGVGQIVVLLQIPARHVLPVHRHGIAGMADVQCRRAGCLHHGNQTPEPAGQ